MQPVARKTSSKDKDSCGSNESNGKVEAQAEDQMQANLSLEHWKRAFTEARERVCPARAGGHACGCLPVLDRLVHLLLLLFFHLFPSPGMLVQEYNTYVVFLCR